VKWNEVKCIDKGMPYEQWCSVQVLYWSCCADWRWWLFQCMYEYMVLIISSKRRFRSVSWEVQLLVWDTQTQHRGLSRHWASTEYFSGVNLVRNLGTLTSWNPLGHSRPVTGLIYLLRKLWHFFLAWRIKPAWGLASSLLRFLDNTHRVGGTPLYEWSARRIGPLPAQNKRRKSMSSAGFEPAVPVVGWLQTYTLEHTATGIGSEKKLLHLHRGHISNK